MTWLEINVSNNNTCNLDEGQYLFNVPVWRNQCQKVQYKLHFVFQIWNCGNLEQILWVVQGFPVSNLYWNFWNRTFRNNDHNGRDPQYILLCVYYENPCFYVLSEGFQFGQTPLLTMVAGSPIIAAFARAPRKRQQNQILFPSTAPETPPLSQQPSHSPQNTLPNELSAEDQERHYIHKVLPIATRSIIVNWIVPKLLVIGRGRFKPKLSWSSKNTLEAQRVRIICVWSDYGQIEKTIPALKSWRRGVWGKLIYTEMLMGCSMPEKEWSWRVWI